MPLKDGHGISQRVLDGIREQTVELELMPVSRPGSRPNRRAGEAHCRNVLLGVLSRVPDEVLVMMDRDVVLTDPGAVDAAVGRLCSDDQLKVVHIRYKQLTANANPNHYDMGCIVFKREVASKVLFDVTREGCCCNTLTQHLQACGWRQEYLSDELQAESHTYTGG